jgi:DNA-binding NtrC family response regulator
MPEEPIRVWFCTPDVGFAQVIGRALGAGFETRASEEFSLAATRGQESWWNVVLIDLREVAGEDGIDTGLRLMDGIKQSDEPPPIVVMLSDDDHVFGRKVIENGAYDTVSGPPDVVELRLILRRAHKFYEAERELRLLRSQEKSAGRLHELIGSSESMQRVFDLARKVAPCDVSVLITGETGTGKDLLAHAVHHLSPRSTGPFVAFSCANLPETLIEDELFGHEKGAFTGAIGARRGRFEVADQGTLFLDEIGDLALGLQAKLLRVLQQRSFERLGSNTAVTVNIRLVCATHRNLEEMVKQGTFREDLYYRLNVVQLQLPPLRERRDGIPVLAHHFLEKFAKQFAKKTRRFSHLSMRALEEHAWPGNVRELENIVQRAVVVAEGPVVEIWHLPAMLRNGFEQPQLLHPFEEEVRDFKRRLIVRTLRECGGRKAEAARTLGLARGYLHRLINQLQIQPEEVETGAGSPEEHPPADRVM